MYLIVFFRDRIQFKRTLVFVTARERPRDDESIFIFFRRRTINDDLISKIAVSFKMFSGRGRSVSNTASLLSNLDSKVDFSHQEYWNEIEVSKSHREGLLPRITVLLLLFSCFSVR